MTVAVGYAGPDDLGPSGAGPDDACVLGVIGFDTGRPAALDPACPFLTVPLPVLGDPSVATPAPRLEVWRASGRRERLDSNGLTLARAGDWLLGMACVSTAGRDGLELATRDLYARIFAACAVNGCGYLLRVFHYLPRIGEAEDDGPQRYEAFNAGRHAAFAAAGRDAGSAPAASALGIPVGGSSAAAEDHVWAYFLAGASQGVAIENARQISAYRYPRRYGQSSPLFSRAMIVDPEQNPLLLVSGTASIVGHESRHPGSAAAQADEIARNLHALLERCGVGGWRDPGDLRLKIYLRRPQDAGVVADRLAAAGFAALGNRLFLKADICRNDLLVEIEACGRLQQAAEKQACD